jgi:tetratricopeptide (TPR) repeat protein
MGTSKVFRIGIALQQGVTRTPKFTANISAQGNRDKIFSTSVFCFMRFFLILVLSTAAALSQKAPAPNEEVGSKACSGCHTEIYRKYSATGMARSSGRTASGPFQESFDRAGFSDPDSGADYRVSPAMAGYRLEFSRSASGVQGARTLEWFIGSGSVGRSYLFSLDGFLFQSPVSYYSLAAKWGISPGYQQYRTINMTRVVETACLQCHASQLQPLAGIQNRFGRPPFLEGGIGCERCHGPGKNHVARMTAGSTSGPRQIVNPSKLDPARRDGVCAQCHLTGAARIARARSQRESYRPGYLLSDYLAVFVWSDAESSALTATSHYEKLEQSACKKSSSDRLWCGSCHDPHDQPPASTRAQYYRERCQGCHQASACKESQQVRRAAGDDCTSCHMPRSQTPGGEHVVFTDHAIPRRQVRPAPAGSTGHSLKSFWKTETDERDLALGYAAAASTNPSVRSEALQRLQKAAARGPQDLTVLSQLAQFYDRMGEEENAMALCERIVRADPSNTAAAVNLAIYWIKRGRAQEAMGLWEKALRRNPALTGARVNLAVAQYRSGDATAAETTLIKALEYDPDLEVARKLLAEIRAGRKAAP